MAVNVTLVPAHMLWADAEILTEGVTFELTVIVIALLVAVEVLVQPAVLVITTVTTALFVSAEFWYVELLVPTLLPFSFH